VSFEACHRILSLSSWEARVNTSSDCQPVTSVMGSNEYSKIIRSYEMGSDDSEAGTKINTVLPQIHKYPLADQVCRNATALAGRLMKQRQLICFDQGQTKKLTF